MKTSDASYETIDHTADLGYICRAATLAGLFENCGVSFAEMVFGPGGGGESAVTKSIDVKAGATDELLVHFLNDLLFLWESEPFVPVEVTVSEISANHVCATVAGEKYDPAKHDVATEVKAATYHQLRVDETDDGWMAHVIFDV
jgi:SHS2 domain-containing protein